MGYQEDGWSYISNIVFTNDGGQNWDTIWNTVYNDTTISLRSIQFLNDITGWGVGDIMVDSISQTAILKTNDSGTTWEINPDLVFNFPACGFPDIYFSDFDNGWIVGGCQTGQVILHTADGGNTWETQYNNSSISFNSVYFIDNETGWAAGGSSSAYPGSPSIVRTTNGGDTWQLATIPYYPTCSLSGIHFSDMDNGWAVGGIGLILKTDDGGINWSPQSEGTTDIPLNDICFVDSLYGWATGSVYNRATLLHTQNGGSSWVEQGLGYFFIKSICFANHLNGWIVGEDMYDGGVIIYTNNGGNNWEQQYNELGNEYSGVCFVDSDNGWVTGALGRILHTNTGGVDWEIQNSGTTEYVRDVFFIDQNNGWAAGHNGMILHTDNGGILWTEQISGTNENLHSIHFWDSENGGAVGENGTIILTTDGGISWELQISGQICDLQGVFLTDQESVWVVGGDYIDPNYYSVILNTSDGGSTWESQTKPSALNRFLKSIWFTDQNKGWVAGSYGTILHTDNGGQVGMMERLYSLDNMIKVETFPNPVNYMVTIKFEIIQKSKLKMSILNQTGQVIEILFEGSKEKGTHQLTWDSSDLPSGIYFIKLQTDKEIATKKIIKK